LYGKAGFLSTIFLSLPGFPKPAGAKPGSLSKAFFQSVPFKSMLKDSSQKKFKRFKSQKSPGILIPVPGDVPDLR
jgi:hypothetical protein